MASGDIRHRTVETNGIRMHIAEQGEGPLVVLCHGFPESWYSWRHQLPALAAAGFHAVAPDMRGYGQTDRPEAIDQYTLFHLAGDIVGLLDALGEKEAVIAGHDWGAPVAWHAALWRPDRFRGVIGLSVPFRPRGAARPTAVMPETHDAEADLDFYAAEFTRTGFRGGLNWYRNIDRNWELTAPFAGKTVDVPALYVAGERDLVVSFPGMDQLLPNLTKFVPKLRQRVVLPGCGHWTQQERPTEVNTAIIDFLKSL